MKSIYYQIVEKILLTPVSDLLLNIALFIPVKIKKIAPVNSLLPLSALSSCVVCVL